MSRYKKSVDEWWDGMTEDERKSARFCATLGTAFLIWLLLSLLALAAIGIVALATGWPS